MHTTYRFVVTVLGAVTLAALVFLAPPAAAAPVSTDDLLNAKDNTRDWLQYSQTYDGHRYVRLNQINRLQRSPASARVDIPDRRREPRSGGDPADS